jgi:glycosyltransferase involved in cell wall biosynthesis
MYFEKPVIASSVGEIPIFIEKYHVGIQVPRGDVDALRQAMITLATNPDMRNEYINNIKLLNKSSELSWRTIIRDLFDEIKEKEIW